MKESRPVRMLPTLHNGFHDSGWTKKKEFSTELGNEEEREREEMYGLAISLGIVTVGSREREREGEGWLTVRH